jgi:transaldolase
MSDGTYFQRVAAETPTRFWINNPSAPELMAALASGAVSCTTNPAYCAKLIQSESAYIRALIDEAIWDSADDDEAADRVVRQVSARLLGQFLPLYERSYGEQGYVTIQSDPRKDEDARWLVDAALRYRDLGPNFMAKIPVTSAGLEAIEKLVPEHIPICATEVFALDQAVAACEAYGRAAERSGARPPLFVTHITGIFDEYLTGAVAREGIAISQESLAWAGSTVARAEYHLMKQRGFQATMLGGGARSTRHFTDFVGGDIHVTINWSTARELIEWDPPVVSRIDVETPQTVLAELTERLPDFRRAGEVGGLPVEEFADFGPLRFFRNSFVAGYERLLAEIAARRRVH